MKIRELIHRLEAVAEEHSDDLPVYAMDMDEGHGWIPVVDVEVGKTPEPEEDGRCAFVQAYRVWVA